MVLLANGKYKIVNVKFPNQDADLLDGKPTANVAGHVQNTGSFNMVWNLKNVGNQENQFTLTNVAPTSDEAYASVDQIANGAGLVGSTSAITWTAIPALHSGQYWILAPSELSPPTTPIGLVWSLPEGADRTQIKLGRISVSDLAQVWIFQSVGN